MNGNERMNEERSPLWGLGASAAAASGIGAAIYRGRHELLDAVRASNRDVAAESANFVRKMQGFNAARAQSSVIDPTYSSMLSTMEETDVLRRSVASAAYEATLAGKRTTHQAAYESYQNIMGKPDILSAYSAAVSDVTKFQGNTSLFSNRIGEITETGVYPRGRFEEMKSAVVSQGQYAATRKAIKPTELSAEAATNLEDITRRFRRAEGSSYIKFGGIYSVKDMLQGQEVTTPILKAKIAGKSVNIPLLETGLTYSGEDLTARYVTRGAYTEAGASLNYIERYTGMIEEILSKKKNQTAINQSIHALNLDMIDTMSQRDGAARSQAVWSMPEQVLPSGGRVKSRMLGMQSVSAAGQGFDQDKVAQLMDKGLYPSGSPGVVAKGTYYTEDVAEALYGPLGRWFPIEKRPDQFIRPEFGVTAEAKMRATPFAGSFGKHYSRLDRKIKGIAYDKLIYGGHDPVSGMAYSAPQLTTFYAKTGDAGFAADDLNRIMFAEEAVLSESVADMMEYERITQNKISLKEGFGINKEIASVLEGAEVGQVRTLESPVGGGRFLGVEAATGKEIWSKAVGSGRTDVIAAELSGQDTATLYTRERLKLEKGDYWKFFSEESKALGSVADQNRMRSILKAAGASDVAKATGQTVEAVQTAKLLEKNTMAKVTQQMEALSMFTASRMDRGLLPNDSKVIAEMMVGNPMVATGASALLEKGAANAEYNLSKNMVSLGKRFDFSQREMQMTFGLMSKDHLERMVAEGLISESERRVIGASKGVVGLSKMRLGSPATYGVGGMASMEHTGFRLLAMKGEEGKMMAAELATRLTGKGEFLPAERLLASAIGETGISEKALQAVGLGKAPVDKSLLGQLREADLIGQEGRYVNLGRKVSALGGSNQLYIPGLGEAAGMLEGSISPKGEVIQSPFKRELIAFQKALRTGEEDAIELAARSFRDVAHQMYEQQGAARGKVLGSAFLTGIRQTYDESESNIFKISKQSGEQMFDDLIDRSTSDSQRRFLQKQKDDLLSGKVMTGGVWRHPTTGPESFQFANYQIDPNLKGAMISAPAKTGILSLGGGPPKEVDISQMVGMKGDFDKDMYALSVIANRDTLDRANRRLTRGVEAGYTDYLFNHYALQETIESRKDDIAKSISDMSRPEAFSVGARKLTEANIATPQVNAALQKLKIGLQYSAPQQYRPLAELFWHLEEAAIGGKHGVMEGELYQNIAHAVQQKDVKTMEGVLTGLLGERRTVQGTMTIGDKVVQQSLTIDPAEWAKTAVNAASDVSNEVDIAYKAAQVSKGKQSIREVNSIVEMMYARKAGSLDVAQSLMEGQGSVVDSMSRTANRTIRRGGAQYSTFKRVLSGSKGLVATGFAAATAITAMAPSISGTLDPTPDGGGAKGISPDTLGPPQGMGMNPPEPRIMTSPKVYDMGGMQAGSRGKIRMSLNDTDNMSMKMTRRINDLSNNGNVNIRTIDDRSVLDSHLLANKIYERL